MAQTRRQISTLVTTSLATALAAVFAAVPAAAGANELGLWLPPVAQQEGFHMRGIVDTGFRVQHTSGKTTLSMLPNGDETSAINLRARETLPGGGYVRMKLSMPFKSDTGTMQQPNNALFNEEILAVGGQWGELAMGRTPNIFSGNGDFGLCPQINPSSMGTNFSNSSLAPIFSSGYNFNNSFIYNSPRINGFHTAIQYSNGRAADETPRSKTDQLINVAVTWKGGPFKFAVIGGYFDNDSDAKNGIRPNAEKNIVVMGSWWPGDGWSFHAAYQYVRDGMHLGGSFFKYTGLDGNGRGIALSERGVDSHAGILCFGKRFGNQKISAVIMANHVKYMGDSEVVGDRDGWRISPATIYRYFLSKRTHVWAAASMTHGTGIYERARNHAADPLKTVDFGAGLTHHF